MYNGKTEDTAPDGAHANPRAATWSTLRAASPETRAESAAIIRRLTHATTRTLSPAFTMSHATRSWLDTIACDLTGASHE